MPYRICKRIEIDNAHMLSKHAGNCRYPHGHTRQVEFVLESTDLNTHDMVCDFVQVKHAVQEFVAAWDHAMCMNSADARFAQMRQAFGERVIEFADRDPTTEVMARTMFDRVSRKLADMQRQPDPAHPPSPGMRLRRVRIWETTTCWAEYEE